MFNSLTTQNIQGWALFRTPWLLFPLGPEDGEGIIHLIQHYCLQLIKAGSFYQYVWNHLNWLVFERNLEMQDASTVPRVSGWLTTWQTDHGWCSWRVVCLRGSTGAPQRGWTLTVLLHLLHLRVPDQAQKSSDSRAVLGCVRGKQEAENRRPALWLRVGTHVQ